MAYRTIYISNPAYLSVKQNKLILVNELGESSVPLEDINSIIVENMQVTMSAPLMNACANKDIAVFFCDEKHLPSGITLPFQDHVRQRKRIFEQIDLTVPMRKKIWQKIVMQKITNQGLVLKILGRPTSNHLIKIAEKVNSGDSTNLEGYAARLYFSELFESNFRRFDDDAENSALNYGYAILRGCIARSLVSYGFIPSIGIHHRNEYNNFNLADDIIEPFRPLVDLFVSSVLKPVGDLDNLSKTELVGILGAQLLMGQKRISTLNAIELTVKSLASVVSKKNINELCLPVIVPYKKHTYV